MDASVSPLTDSVASASGQTISQTANQSEEKRSAYSASREPLFENPFSIEDLMVFDDAALQRMLSRGCFGLTTGRLARSVQSGSPLQRRQAVTAYHLNSSRYSSNRPFMGVVLVSFTHFCK
jgi:hypothetical protein